MQNSEINLKIEEAKCTLAVSILSGYHKIASKGMNWMLDMVDVASGNIRRNKLDKFLQ